MPKFNGANFLDDRMFISWIGKCYLGPPQDGVSSCTIFHETPPKPPGSQEQELWAVVTCENTARWPIVRVDHFREKEKAIAYRESIVEPETPLVSLDGRGMDPKPTYEYWLALKIKEGWQEYDYKKVFLPGGGNPQETVFLPSEGVRIFV